MDAWTEDRAAYPPPVSLLLALAAVLPVPVAAGICLIVNPDIAQLIARLTIAWSGAVLCFLAGVRRGLSFRQPEGATLAQLAAMFWVFVLGAGALLLPWPVPRLILLLMGYVSLAVLDPLASRRREAPRYFAYLRPMQMALPVVGLLILLVHILSA